MYWKIYIFNIKFIMFDILNFLERFLNDIEDIIIFNSIFH